MRNPLDAYKQVEKATLTGRELEASVFLKATGRLSAVQQNWNSPDRDEMLDESLRYNQRLWTLIQSDIASGANLLPAELKQSLLSLSLFVDKRTFETISFPDPKKLSILIDINRNIAEALQESPHREPVPA